MRRCEVELRYYPSLLAFANRVEVDERQVRRWLVESRSVPLRVVDEVFTRLGRPDVLNELYPIECDDALLEEAA